MKFSKNLLAIIIALLTLNNSGIAQSSYYAEKAAAKTKKPVKKTKIKLMPPKRHVELGHSYGLQSYPGKTIYPVNTQTLPTTYTSHMGNDW